VKKVVLPNTTLTVSRFSFGTGSLLNVGTSKARQRLLGAAADVGFSHFDTAPYYGFGVAERDLGAVVGSRTDLTIATKVGLYAPGGEAQWTPVVLARKALGRVAPALSRPLADWSVRRARMALDHSLRRLRRDSIDLYMLHEPDPRALDTDEWSRWQEQEKSARVRVFGIALNTERLRAFIDTGTWLGDVVQTRDSIENREADVLIEAGRPLQITYGYVSGARKAPDRPLDVLEAALKRNRSGSIVVSTTKIGRLQQYARALEAT
jgi:aryl-alcohol dehydrogenase-like predicted oxidoreductase